MAETAIKLNTREPVNDHQLDVASKGMVENAPMNILYCNRDLVVTYINPKSRETLKQVEKYLPVSIEKIVGSSIDVFHKAPEHQRRLLASDRNLPIRSIINVGPEKLDLLASAIYDTENTYVGVMVTWDIVTAKLKADEELAKIRSMMENAPVNVLFCDTDFTLTYINPKSRQTLSGLEKLLPKPVDQLLGQKIDIFHKNPDHQRRLLGDQKNLPHRAKIKLGPETLDLLVSPIFDQNRKYLGAMVTWDVITQKVELVSSISEASRHLSAAAAELNATATQMNSNAGRTNKESSLVSTASEEVARGVETVATNTEEMSASIREIARNANDAATAAKNTASQAERTNTTMSKLGASSQEVGDVIKVISSIAQQTNLLALNATIEAARAGDAGRGFAVVANEVKELAKQTAKATEDITTKIGAIQKDTGSSIDAINSITESIGKLNGIAGAIAASVEEQQATTNEVARVVQESAKGVANINASIKTVSEASNETQVGANQVLSAAQSLAQLATQLEVLVKKIEV